MNKTTTSLPGSFEDRESTIRSKSLAVAREGEEEEGGGGVGGGGGYLFYVKLRKQFRLIILHVEFQVLIYI